MDLEKQNTYGAENRVADRNAAPIFETENAVSYLGVELPKGTGGDFCPKKENYRGYINEDFSLELQKKIAASWKMDEPILIEGGTSIGKTTTVKKMCADLGYEVYYKNLNGATDVEDLMGRYVPSKTPTDPEFRWSDGPITQGLRQDGEKIRVIILDEYNAANPNIVIRLHEVLDELEKNGEVVLAEDASERVKVNKTRTKVIALTNPPGKGYLDRQPLDPAQLRRWNYQKEVSELPTQAFSDSVDMLFGFKQEETEAPQEKFLLSNEGEIPVDQLRDVPGMREMMGKYKEFHQAAKELLKNRKIAQDQPQAFMYDDRMEPNRVLKFIQHFYRGDINGVWREALQYFYVNKLEDKTDKQKLLELINAIEYVPPVESRRKGLEREVRVAPAEAVEQPMESPEEVERLKTLEEIEKVRAKIAASGTVPDGFFEEKREGLSGSLMEQMRSAKEIMGKKDFLGVEEIENAFGIKIKMEDVPNIPFSQEDLERAKELNQFLILRVDRAVGGVKMTMKNMETLLAESFAKEGYGKIFYNDWFKNEDFFTTEAPKLSWALVSKEIIPDSTSKDYLQQTERIAHYLQEEVFKGKTVPKEYRDALAEFFQKKSELQELITSDWQKAAALLMELSINKLTRQSPVECMYDMVAYLKNNKERVLENQYTWTSRRGSDGELVRVGYFASVGAIVDGYRPDVANVALGVSFSRSL